MTEVWQHSKAAGNDLLVLLALADIANDEGECWPSIRLVAAKCRIDTRTTQRRIRSLEGIGEVFVMRGQGKSSTPGGTRSNRYRIVIHIPDDNEEGVDLPGVAICHRGAGARGGVAQAPPEPSLRTVIESSTTLANIEDDFADVWSIYPRKVDRGKALKAFTARRKAGVSAEELRSATQHYAASVCGAEPQFIKHGATFFGRDEPYADFIGGIPEGAVVARPESGRNMSTVDGILSQLSDPMTLEVPR